MGGATTALAPTGSYIVAHRVSFKFDEDFNLQQHDTFFVLSEQDGDVFRNLQRLSLKDAAHAMCQRVFPHALPERCFLSVGARLSARRWIGGSRRVYLDRLPNDPSNTLRAALTTCVHGAPHNRKNRPLFLGCDEAELPPTNVCPYPAHKAILRTTKKEEGAQPVAILRPCASESRGDGCRRALFAEDVATMPPVDATVWSTRSTTAECVAWRRHGSSSNAPPIVAFDLVNARRQKLKLPHLNCDMIRLVADFCHCEPILPPHAWLSAVLTMAPFRLRLPSPGVSVLVDELCSAHSLPAIAAAEQQGRVQSKKRRRELCW